MIILSEEHGEARRLASLEAENRHLRALLLAGREAEAQRRRSARLGRAEAARIRTETEARESRYRHAIAELRQSADRQSLLMQEMAHRVKNTLAMVQAIGTQTLRTAASLDAARGALDARLHALAKAHDVLLQDAWTTAPLGRIVASAVALHGGEADRFAVSGPEIALAARAGLTVALLLHELGTNAAKYGALSAPAGRVAITWTIDGAAVEKGPVEAGAFEDAAVGARFRFRWAESGGPSVSPPHRTGFGSRLIERSLVQGFGGRVDLAYPVTGLVLAFEAPLARLAA